MIKFHPSNQQLMNLADGVLSPSEALIVSAHCDMCERCMTKTQLFTDAHSEEIFDTASSEEGISCFGDMLDQITSEASERELFNKTHAGDKELPKKQLELDGRAFILPRTLNRLSESTGNWSHLIGKIWQAPVNLGGETVANFIYMGKGGRVPEHTHRGSEMTLVVNGHYGDGLADYDSGDFTVMNGSHIHTPSTASDEGCLVFTIVDKPLHFTSGWARLINPFSHLFFK